MSHLLSCFFSQAGGGSRRSLHPHQASPGRRGNRVIPQTSAGGDGPQGGGTSHLCPHGARHAEVSPRHKAAVLPQHGEHHQPPAVLHLTQYDPQGKAGSFGVFLFY